MGFELSDRWLWDSWYAHDGALWHGFFLQAPKAVGDPDQRHWHASIHHATSPDLCRWTSLGTCFGPAPGPAWDDYTTWTGSVVRGDDGLWHLFYTGTCRAEGGLKQRIGHAVSLDLHAWERVGEGRLLDRADPYEEYEPQAHPGRWHDRAFRDPWVYRDPDGAGWLMAFTARDGRHPDRLSAGAIGLARSTDLYDWTLEPPMFTGVAGELEVPQVLQIGGRWYCLFCTSARFWSEPALAALAPAGTGTHYLVGDGPRGPWRLGPAPMLDGAPFPRRYAGRLVADGGRFWLLGFRWQDSPGGPFVGALSDPAEVVACETGALRLG